MGKDDLTLIENLDEFLHQEEDDELAQSLETSSTPEEPEDSQTESAHELGEITETQEIPLTSEDNTGSYFVPEEIKAESGTEESAQEAIPEELTQEPESTETPSEIEHSSFGVTDEIESLQGDQEEVADAESDLQFNLESEQEVSQSTEETLQTEELPDSGLDQSADFAQIEEPLENPIETIEAPVVKEAPRPSMETFSEAKKEVNQFAQNAHPFIVKTGGNPPFSIMIENIKFKEDALSITQKLKEYGVINDQNESMISQSLGRGHLMISQLSEYTAIVLVHKLRNLDIDICMGLSNVISPFAENNNLFKGPVSKENITQNKSVSWKNLLPLEAKNILVSTGHTLPGYKIIEHLGVVHQNKLISRSSLESMYSQNNFTSDLSQDGVIDLQNKAPDLYDAILEELKLKAFQINANAIIGLNYHLTPMVYPSKDHRSKLFFKYCLTGTANALLVQKKVEG